MATQNKPTSKDIIEKAAPEAAPEAATAAPEAAETTITEAETETDTTTTTLKEEEEKIRKAEKAMVAGFSKVLKAIGLKKEITSDGLIYTILQNTKPSELEGISKIVAANMKETERKQALDRFKEIAKLLGK